jgi:hypothetical protein
LPCACTRAAKIQHAAINIGTTVSILRIFILTLVAVSIFGSKFPGQTCPAFYPA